MKPLKRLERYLSAIFKLGRTEWMAKRSFAASENNEQEIKYLRERVSALGSLENAIGRHLETQKELTQVYQSEAARAFSDLSRRIDQLVLYYGKHDGAWNKVVHNTEEVQKAVLEGEGFRAFKDTFYHRLENRYRGNRAEIKDRLRVYLPDVEAAVIRTDGLPVLDIGCGRGEWLELLSEADITATGMDVNPVQFEIPQNMNLDIHQGDAVEVLSKAETSSLSVISAHHVVEHLPFETVAWITREAFRVLAPGGVLLFETPNTRNVLVGATTFYTDPTHIRPMPEQVLGVLFETAGFRPVESRGLNPHERLSEFLNRPDFNAELAHLLFGPQDLVVLGIKSEGEKI